jgi:hypothetical protein
MNTEKGMTPDSPSSLSSQARIAEEAVGKAA